MRKKSPSLNFFERYWHKLDPANLQIEELDPQRYQITYTVHDKVFTVVLRKNTKLFKELNLKKNLHVRITRDNLIEITRLNLCREAERKARLLMKRFIASNPKLSINSGSINVSSNNQRDYLIEDDVFEIIGETTEFRCVYVENNSLPPSDKALAKALVVAYRPDLIDTLKGLDDIP